MLRASSPECPPLRGPPSQHVYHLSQIERRGFDKITTTPTGRILLPWYAVRNAPVDHNPLPCLPAILSLEKVSCLISRLYPHCDICRARTPLNFHQGTYKTLGSEAVHDVVVRCAPHDKGLHAWAKARN